MSNALVLTESKHPASNRASSNRAVPEKAPRRLHAVPAPTERLLPRGGAQASTDGFGDYLRRISAYPVLAAEEEIELARSIEAGLFAQERLDELTAEGSGRSALKRDLATIVSEGEHAHHRFVCCNLKLVVSIAKQYSGHGMPMLDLVQEGNIGLERAIRKFDYALGYKFSTYASWWIKQAISRGIADSGHLVRVPVHTAEKINKLGRISRELESILGRPPTSDEIADEAQMTQADVERLLAVDRDGVSLQVPVGADDASAELGDLIEDGDLVPVADAVGMQLRNTALRKRVHTLPQREAQVVELRYGFAGGNPMTFEQVGRIMGVSRERVRQIESRALASLRRAGDIWS